MFDTPRLGHGSIKTPTPFYMQRCLAAADLATLIDLHMVRVEPMREGEEMISLWIPSIMLCSVGAKCREISFS